ncbi:MAG TPA: MotA/TolQ/ExbB proton channel family protein [Steroidobacteraceae bacterium]|nr:MotA/TolQ/ExbB proton channel family protein [Steroidobacteraceae bacterium]
MEQSIGFAHFLAQTDAVGRAILVIMLVMSVASWYLIVTKAIAGVLERQRSGRFVAQFWDAPSVATVEARLGEGPADEPFTRLARHALAAHRKGDAEFLTRAMRRVIDENTARLESGLTVLASVGSTAPFVGLFGTVWGVYHALVAIGLSGQGTLEKVAGPVGEALIMTALGLAVAIPAVLAYNGFVRSNRLALAQLDAFAHDLYAVLTTGSHVGETKTVVPLKPAAKGG